MASLRFAFTIFLLCSVSLWCQPPSGTHPEWSCGADAVQRDPAVVEREAAINRMLYAMLDRAGKGERSPLRGDEVLTIPVVVHIVHDGGSEDIPEALVLAGIEHMNQAYANVGFYDPATGVDVGIQFCLAKRDPEGKFTNGITRNRSSLTEMTLENDDIALKDLARWDPREYLNIWLVREISSAWSGPGVAGYAYFPSSYGMPEDGIVGEARWFGSSPDNSKIFAHEAGHYLGLYHTFQGGCANNDCLADGDMVCDTPPDASTLGVTCGHLVNSCMTDPDDRSINNPFRPTADGGIGDQIDLYTDYMDYGRLECYTLFTQGQKERMRAVLETVRKSLLESRGCLSPCASNVTAAFSASATAVPAGTIINFTNMSAGADAYEWRVDGAVIATSRNASHTFNDQGRHAVVLRAFNGDPACTDDDTIYIDVTCPARASFTASSRTVQPGQSVTFTNTSVGATSYRWFINGVPIGTATDLQRTFTQIGGYRVMLVACNGVCCDTSLATFISVGACAPSSRWNVWYFGYGAGIDFNSGAPVVLTDGRLYAKDGTSTICDRDGNLLFYSDGDTVWNRKHKVMLNGTGLWGHEAATQSATIVPMPGSDSLYYIFTVTDWWQSVTGIRYSIVDMSLDGGLGAIASMKNVPLHDNVSEEVAVAMHANCRDIWVVTHEMNNSRFLAYRLTSAGLDPNPVITDVGPATGNAFPRFGYLKFSRDGRRLSNTLAASQTEPTVVLFDFDKRTGGVSNPISLADDDELRYAYSSEFSLDGRYLYVTDLLKTVLWQYDLAAGDQAAIHASKLLVASTRQELGCFQMGPDGRIYVTSRWSPTISVINYPDKRGAACGFVEGAIDLKGRTSSLGLPGRIADAGSVWIDGPKTLCAGDSVATYTVHASECGQGVFTWRVTGSAEIIGRSDSSVTVRATGGATGGGAAAVLVSADGACGILTDSIAIDFGAIRPLRLGNDTALCGGASVLLDAGPGYASYRWQDGASTRTYQTRGPGRYWVEVTSASGCIARDTVEVAADDRSIAVDLGPDRSVCDGVVTLLDAGPGALRYRWQDGSAGRTYTAYRPGTYWVVATGYCGSATDTVRIAGGEFASATLSLGSPGRAPLMPGSVIAMPMVLAARGDRAGLVGRSIAGSIRFDASVLYPVGETPFGTVKGRDRIIPFKATIGDSDTLVVLRFMVSLGDTDRTRIRFDLFHFLDECGGHVDLAGDSLAVLICETGGPRLVSLSGRAALKVRGMPATDGVTIGYSLVESGRTRLSLVDALGRRVRLLLDDDPGPGERELPLDVSDLSSGLYFLLLETPSQRVVERVPVR